MHGNKHDGSVPALVFFAVNPAKAGMAAQEKSGNAPDGDTTEQSRCPRGGRSFPTRSRCTAIRAFHDPRARFEDEGPATSPLRRSAARCGVLHRLAKRRTGRFLVWDLRPWCHDVTGHVPERESNPRQTDQESVALPSELSSGGRTGIEPATRGLHRRSASELSSACETPSSGIRHTPRQRRAHRAGVGTRTAGCRSIDASHWRLVEGANPSRTTAPARRPCPASGHSASCCRTAAPLSGHPFPRAVHARMLRDADRSCNNAGFSVCERAKTKRPRHGVRGRSRSSEIGVTDLRERGISRWIGCRVEAGLPVARTGARRAVRVRHGAGCLCGVSCLRLLIVVACMPRARTLRLRIARCKRVSDERMDGIVASDAVY